MPEIPLKISRAIICKKAKELRNNNFIGQGESVIFNFAEHALMPKGIENPEKEELRCRNREGSSRTSLDSTAIDALLIVFILFYFIFLKQLKETFEF